MPIYEYYCKKCHAIYNFFARSLNPAGKPVCPKCKSKALTREISVFAFTQNRKDGGEEEDFPVDEATMMAAMDALADKAGAIDEEDPRQAANLIREFTKMTGVELGGAMEEAMSRLEAGEDPESIEAELGDTLDSEDPFSSSGNRLSSALRKQLPPRRDNTLYDF